MTTFQAARRQTRAMERSDSKHRRLVKHWRTTLIELSKFISSSSTDIRRILTVCTVLPNWRPVWTDWKKLKIRRQRCLTDEPDNPYCIFQLMYLKIKQKKFDDVLFQHEALRATRARLPVSNVHQVLNGTDVCYDDHVEGISAWRFFHNSSLLARSFSKSSSVYISI